MRIVKELDEGSEPDLSGLYESEAINALISKGSFRVVMTALRSVVRSVLHDFDTPEVLPRLLELVTLQDQIRLATTHRGGAGMLALSYGVVGRKVLPTVGSEMPPASWVRSCDVDSDAPAGYFMVDEVDTDWEVFKQYTDATTISLNGLSVGQPGSGGYSWEVVQPIDDGSWIIPLGTTLTTTQRLGAGVGIVKGSLSRSVPVQDAIYEIGNGLLRNGFGFVVGGVLVTCYHITYGEPLVMSDMGGNVIHIVADVVDPERDLVLYGGTTVPFSTDIPVHTKCCVVNPKVARRITLECVGSEVWAGGNCLQFATLVPVAAGYQPLKRDRGIRGWSGLPIISDEYGVVGIYGRSCCNSTGGDWHVVSPTCGGKEVTFASEVNLALGKHERQDYEEHMVISVPTGFGKSTVFPVKLYQALLLIDNAPGHPQAACVADEKVEVVFLPPNSTPLLQPLDQGIMRCVKATYTRLAFQGIRDALDVNPQLSVTQLWKNFNIADAIILIAEAVQAISPSSVNACWRPLWRNVVGDFRGFPAADAEVQNIRNIAMEIGGEGLSDMAEVDLQEHLEDNSDFMSNQELEEMTMSSTESEDDDAEGLEQREPPAWTLEKFAEVFQQAQILKEKILEYDPSMERAHIVTRG
uniref:DDE-1 domain-containing protein n=1 Tax=Trichuris muris TaxID=70415 RepID=A0A5S6QTX9_TRIMR